MAVMMTLERENRLRNGEVVSTIRRIVITCGDLNEAVQAYSKLKDCDEFTMDYVADPTKQTKNLEALFKEKQAASTVDANAK